MIGADRLLSDLTWLVKHAPRACRISVCAQARTQRVLRFAYERVHQNLAQDSVTVYVRVFADRRVGVATTDNLGRVHLARALARAVEIAKHTPPLKDAPVLPSGASLRDARDVVRATAEVPAARLLASIKHLFHLCKGVDVTLAGSLVAAEDETAVANSAGVASYHASTVCGTRLVTMYRKLSGYASGVHRDIRKLDNEALLEHALKQCLHKRAAVTVPVGTYEVVLEPEAVAELLIWLGYIAFGAKQIHEHSSCLSGRMGERLMHPSVTIDDDGNDPAGLRLPFDPEGVPKQRVRLIDRGRAAGFVTDSTYAALYHQPSTGHAQTPDGTDGPVPVHLFMAPGTVSRAEMIRRCDRGLLIPRFHYVNGLLNPREALMTGLTREGVFLIKDGKCDAPVTTLRFTQSLLDALRHVVAISKERQVVGDPASDVGCAVVPTVHLKKFRFTGRSEE